jgi:putative ABC transport system substrate-binding protein
MGKRNMKRRDFITLLGGAASAWPLAARAQQSMPVVGVLGIFSLDGNTTPMRGLRKGLEETGFFINRNVSIETRSGPYDGLPGLAADLVNYPVNVLVATGSARVAQVAMAAAPNLPIVFANGSDPVKVGLVASMNRPGANATGVSFYTSTLGPKRLEILRELIPQVDTIAFLVNPTNPVTQGDIKDMGAAARSIGQRLIMVSASTENEIETAFAKMARDQVDAVIVNVDAFFASRRHQLAFLAERYRIPASYNNGMYTRAGGLISYGDDRSDSYRQVGVYVGRILKGDKPADLPIMQPTKFELVINLKTAKALGLDVPPTLLARADEVIE